MSVKNKTLIFIFFLLVLFSTAILFVFTSEQKEEISITKEKYNLEIKNVYDKIIDRYDKFYTATKLNEHINISIKQSLKNLDRKKLYKFSFVQYRILARQNPDLVMMRYYDAQNNLILDMKNPNTIKEKILTKIPKKVYEKGKVFKQYTKKGNMLIFNIIHPIFFNEVYIGAMELTVDMQYILKEMLHYTGVEGVILVRDANVFNVKYKTLKNMNLFNTQLEVISGNTVESKRGVTYFTNVFDIKDKKGVIIAKIELFKNISFIVDGHHENIINIIMFLAFLVILTVVLVNYSLGRGIKRLENRYRNAAEYKHMINAHVMVVNTGLDRKIIEVSHMFCDVSGYTVKELIGEPCEIMKESSMPKKLYDDIFEILKEDGIWTGELKNETKKGDIYWVQATIQAVVEDENIVEYHAIMHNITDKKEKEELVIIDGLTDIYNRRHFDELFPRMLKGIKRDGGCFNFILLDIDFFKQYNDIYGHAKGDEALIAVAKAIKNSLHRPDDFCFRLGGEEFGILYKTTNEEDGYLFAQRIRKKIQSLEIEHSGSHIYQVITASFGLVSLHSDHIIEYKEIYKLADEYLYRAKNDGRNKVVSKLV